MSSKVGIWVMQLRLRKAVDMLTCRWTWKAAAYFGDASACSYVMWKAKRVKAVVHAPMYMCTNRVTTKRNTESVGSFSLWKNGKNCKRERSLPEVAEVAFIVSTSCGFRKKPYDGICTRSPVHLVSLFGIHEKKNTYKIYSVGVETHFHLAFVFRCPKSSTVVCEWGCALS